MKNLIYILTLFFSLIVQAQAKRLHHEVWYQEWYCAEVEGRMETRPKHNQHLRIDCETCEEVMELDFADNYAEGIGQALTYAAFDGKKAVLVLIQESQKDLKYILRARITIKKMKLPVRLVVITP